MLFHRDIFYSHQKNIYFEVKGEGIEDAYKKLVSLILLVEKIKKKKKMREKEEEEEREKMYEKEGKSHLRTKIV